MEFPSVRASTIVTSDGSYSPVMLKESEADHLSFNVRCQNGQRSASRQTVLACFLAFFPVKNFILTIVKVQ